MTTREIKFRIKSGPNGEWEYFDLSNDSSIRELSYRVQKGWMVGFSQYTGLKDKNGLEIYEGDILNHCRYEILNGVNVIVVWAGSGFYCGYAHHIPLTEILKKDAVVIGNIWENPELK